MSRITFALFFCAVGYVLPISAATPLKLIRTIPHTGYSEGLDFFDGALWRAVPKAIHKIRPDSGEVLQTYKPATEYSESLVWFKDKLWNVSYSDNKIYAVDRAQVEAAKAPQVIGDQIQLPFVSKGTVAEVHAWGLVHDGKHLIFTGDHGSDKLYFFDTQKSKVVRTLKVTDGDGKPIRDLEDLAWDGKMLWTSSFQSYPGQIFSVDPKTGKAKRFYSIPDPTECSIIDGIAYDKQTLWVTGKNCAKIYLFKKPE